jgi:glutathione-regulated potassium-efflux system protein KefB
MPEIHVGLVGQIVVFLAAAILAVVLFRRIGLSAVLGYLVAGILIGPSGIGFFREPQTLTSIAEIGVVMFLFVIGLELKLDKLIAMKRDILVLGGSQMALTGAIIGLAAWFLGLSGASALIAGFTLALSATSIALQLLEERGELQSEHGQRSFTVLIFQDIMIVPALALVPLLAPSTGEGGNWVSTLTAIGIGIGAIAIIVVAGLYLLNPLFRLLAQINAREVMTATALFIVLGSAELMHIAGMSMALGAFLAGVLLAESNFRHELEADIEPFRGLLLGLFFMSVGMMIDLSFVFANALWLTLAIIGLIAVKFGVVYAIASVHGANMVARLRASSVLTPSGEFSFVLIPLAVSIGAIGGEHGKFLIALAALSMLIGPLLFNFTDMIIRRMAKGSAVIEGEIVEDFNGAKGAALVIGGGRFGQVVNQMLLAARTDVTVIDNDIEMIQAASRFGFKIYFGDGSRLDVLRAAGGDKARIIAVCIDNKEAATRIAEIAKENFPLAEVYIRAYDRRHALEIMNHEPAYIIRETFESAMRFGEAALRGLGVEDDMVEAVEQDIRKRDAQRLAMQKSEGQMTAGMHLSYKSGVVPEPLTSPVGKTKALTAETQEALENAATRPGGQD